MTYGTGAIMAVPGHDERDHEFATAFGIPIVEVISGGEKPIEEAPFEGDGVCVNSGFLNGLRVTEAKEKMIAWLESEKRGTRQVNIAYETGSSHGNGIGASRFRSRILKMEPLSNCQTKNCL